MIVVYKDISVRVKIRGEKYEDIDAALERIKDRVQRSAQAKRESVVVTAYEVVIVPISPPRTQ